MRAKWGIAWLLSAVLLLVLTTAPALAAGDNSFRPLPILPIVAQNSIETQMLGEQPPPAPGSKLPGLEAIPSLKMNSAGDATLSLPRKFELNISIRYNRTPASMDPQHLGNPSLYMKYAMDYRVLSNLRVGLNSYLYRPSEEGFAFQQPQANQLLGVGPELKYDLGRWSFLLKSQVESGNLNQGKDLQNWFRVWYAF
jgi:hypothetical protein